MSIGEQSEDDRNTRQEMRRSKRRRLIKYITYNPGSCRIGFPLLRKPSEGESLTRG